MKKLTIPRIIGIILLGLAVLVYPRDGLSTAIWFVIAGLILLLSKKENSNKYWNKFVDSLKLKKQFGIIMLFDALFWAALVVLTLILTKVLEAPYDQLKLVQFGDSLSLSNVAVYNTIIESFFVTTIISLIVFWLLLITIYSFSRGKIWLTLLNKKASKGFFWRFTGLNLVWCTVWIAITLFFMSTLVQPYGAAVFIILLYLYPHLTTVLHYSYVKSPGFTKNIKKAFGIGIGNLSKFIHPYCYLFIVFVIIYQPQRFAQSNIVLGITLLGLLAFMAWYRTYLRDII